MRISSVLGIALALMLAACAAPANSPQAGAPPLPQQSALPAPPQAAPPTEAPVAAAAPEITTDTTTETVAEAAPVEAAPVEAAVAPEAALAANPLTPEQETLLASLDSKGVAPEILNEVWLNSAPLKLENLRGKVVIVEFWTYG